ncbi:hypothetical protein TIFTF001_007988 [Ficus carica]|uniref:Uncharacterized protein n=1 Tax=Ficus carica TaxID=3494 RepID=A0AA88A3Y7_FICCA|nr:hypothetical protein TIFTF001_007988 [Ficus carica]
MCFAAIHCPPNMHAQQPSRGGELLTHIWLLMNHLGLGTQFSEEDKEHADTSGASLSVSRLGMAIFPWDGALQGSTPEWDRDGGQSSGMGMGTGKALPAPALPRPRMGTGWVWREEAPPTGNPRPRPRFYLSGDEDDFGDGDGDRKSFPGPASLSSLILVAST